jgi:lipopolysaccharide/colanic/teichoic acid biosynthesis glycosyltransferase
MIRFFDFIFSLIGIILIMPIFFVISMLIKIDSKGAIFYKQLRVGFKGKDFFVYKFRTMHINSDKLGLLTVGGRDPRVTKVGYVLRKYKLDELPQLLNVLIGDMSIVGPRPEVRKYTSLYTKEQQIVLDVLPGITDWASLTYKDENTLLSSSNNPELTYIDQIMPEKLKLNLIYIKKRTVFEYFKIIFYTFWAIIK